MIGSLPFLLLIACAGTEISPFQGTPGTDTDSPATPSIATLPTVTDTSQWTPMSCTDQSPCEWDCSGDGLLLEQLGTYTVEFIAACSLQFEAWGASGGGYGEMATTFEIGDQLTLYVGGAGQVTGCRSPGIYGQKCYDR